MLRRQILKLVSILPFSGLLVSTPAIARLLPDPLHIWYTECDFIVARSADEAAQIMRSQCEWWRAGDVGDHNHGSLAEHWRAWDDAELFPFSEPVEDLIAMNVALPPGPHFEFRAMPEQTDDLRCFYEHSQVFMEDGRIEETVMVTRRMFPREWIAHFGPGYFGSTEY